MVSLASRNGEKSVDIAMRVMRAGGSALDAVEAGVRSAEDDPKDTTVGYGGLPNLMGEVELDASIMDGATLMAGAVAGIRHFKNPISIARRVMEQTPHVMLVGRGADLFAEIQGFEKCDLLTPESKAEYEEMRAGRIKARLAAYEKVHSNVLGWYRKYAESAEKWGTVNVISLDRNGNLAVGVSTSGLALKLPGRTGDSPIIGAGNYADNRAGAAASTGRGELAMRVCLAKYLVDRMRDGTDVQEACVMGIRRILDLRDPFGGRLNVLALDRNGRAGAASMEDGIVYCYQDERMDHPEKRESVQVKV